MGFDVSIGSQVSINYYDRIQMPRSFVNTKLTSTYYDLGNQATYTVDMGPVQMAFRGAVVRMIEGKRPRTIQTPDGEVVGSCFSGYSFNWVRAASGWASEVDYDPSMLEQSAIMGGYPLYSQTYLKGYLTRQLVQTFQSAPEVCDLPSVSGETQYYNARYVYRYRYHSPDGSVIAFYQRPEEIPLWSTWSGGVCAKTRTSVAAPEGNFFWSANGNASLDLTNRCRPVIRWADGSTEEFSGVIQEPYVRSDIDATSDVKVAEPYFPPGCSGGELTADLHITDRNGNITTFPAAGDSNTQVRIDPQGRRTVITYDPSGGGYNFTRLLTVDLPSVGNGQPQRYTVHWQTRNVDFAGIWPDVKCHEQMEGLEKPCSNAFDPSVVSIPNPDILDLVESITTPDGRSYRFEYGPWGNLTRVTEPSGAVREWIYGDGANLDYAQAVTPLVNRVENTMCGFIWSGEAMKMQARGVVEERVYPNGLPINGTPAACTGALNEKCFYAVKHSFSLKKLTRPGCDFDQIGASTTGCSQVWKTSLFPDGTVTKTGSNVSSIIASGWSDDDHVSLTVDLHGMPLAKETYWNGNLISATYTGDPATGAIWTDGDVIPIRGASYAILGNSRPTRSVSIRDGLATTTNFFYGNWVDIDPSASVTLKRYSTKPTSVCTFGGIAPVFSDRTNDGCTLSAAGNPLTKTETSYLNYFDPNTTGSRMLLDLTASTRVFEPNSGGTGFLTSPLTEEILRYDEFALAASGRPPSALDAGVGSAAGFPRGNLTTRQRRVSSDKTVSVQSHYYDEGSAQSTTDARGFTSRNDPDFTLCTQASVLTHKTTNALGHVTTTAADCQSGLTLRTTDPNGRSVYTQYDYLGRAVENAGVGDELTALPASGSQPFTRDSSAPTGSGSKPGDARVTSWTEYLEVGKPGNQRVVTHVRDGSPDGHYSKLFTDGLGRTVQTRTEVDPAKSNGFRESITSTAYDGQSRVVSAFVPCFTGLSDSVTAHCSTQATTTTYDGLGRALNVLAPGNRLTTNKYEQDNGRWVTTTISPRNFTKKTFTNLLGQSVEVARQSSLCPGGYCSTKATYDILGRVLSNSDAAGNTVDYSYDMLGRKLTLSDPDMGKALGKHWSYDYDDNGNLIAQTDAKGQRIEMRYDALNRITLKDLPPAGLSADDVTFSYDGAGPKPPAAPMLVSVSPASVPAGTGAFTLTVDGADFAPGYEVRFNGQSRPTTFVSAQRMTATALASDVQSTGSIQVTVVNPAAGGGSSSPVVFLVTNAVTPVITSMTPTSATAGSGAFTLTVNGSNFTSGSTVTFNGQNRATTFVSAQQLTASITAGDVQTAGSFPVTVVNTGGGTSAGATFTVSNAVPAIASFSPTSAAAGSAAFTLTVNGSNFVSGSTVTFNGQNRTTSFVSAQQLTASISAADVQTAGSFPVTVVNPGGAASSPVTFTVSNIPPPVLWSVSPTTIRAGSGTFTLTVTGTDFASGAVVTFNGQSRSTTFVSAQQLTASIPATDLQVSGSYPVTVVNPGGAASAAINFTVLNPLPAISSLSPAAASAGSASFTLSVNGSGFVSGSVVTFNGQNRATTFVSATQLTASIPATDVQTAGSYAVAVVNPAPGASTSAAASFSVTNGTPVISSLSPTTAAKGGAAFTLTVNGSNFVSGAVVTFNGQNRTTTFVSATQLTAAIPATDLQNAGSYPVTVSNPAPGGGTSAAATFTVTNGTPVIVSLSPATAVKNGAAFTLTVNGSNFASGAVVTFNGQNRTTTFVSATQLTASIPATDLQTAGSYSVTAVNPAPGGGASAAATFTVNNPVPAVSSLAPSSAVKGGAAFTLTVNGSNFVSGAVVTFNGQNRTTTFVSATQLTASIPATDLQTGGSYSVTAINPAPGGGASGAATFTVNNPAPAVSSLSPASAVKGGAAFTLTVNGSNFVSGAVVTFNGQSRATSFVSATQLTAAIPATDLQSTGSYPVSVINPAPGGGTSAAATFTVNNPGPVVSSLSPASAIKGGAAFTLTVNGSNFVSGAVVTFNGQSRATSFVSATQLTAPIAATDLQTAGFYPVTVINPAPGGGASAMVTFTVNNPMPATASITPASRGAASGPFTLTVNGSNFVSGAIVAINGAGRATTFVSSSQLTASMLAVDTEAPGTFAITVFNPSPGGGWSNAASLTVDSVVAITLPANGAIFTTPADVTLNASAPGSVSKVEFFRDSTLLGTVTAAPYSFVWTNTLPGTYAVTAKATMTNGTVIQSGAITVNIRSSIAVNGTGVYRASTDFSPLQGQGNWYYLDGNGAAMTFDNADGMWHGSAPWSLLWGAAGHPGTTLDAVRQWRAPVSGIVRITGNVSDGNTSCGNGVIASIRKGAQVLWQQTVNNGTGTFAFDVTTSVASGEALDFVINSRNDFGCDTTNFDPTISYQPVSSTSRASADYSNTQGQANWSYLDSNGTPMTYSGSDGQWHGTEAANLLWSNGGQPSVSFDAVRQWKAPVAGTVRIRGNASDANAACGNGVIVSIRKGTQSLWQQTIDNGNATGFAFDLTVPVMAGEAVSFAINNRGDATCDATNFDPAVQYITTYKASSDYAPAQGFGGWYYLASNGTQMTYNAADGMWHGREQNNLLWSTGGHPGVSLDAVRQWRAPLAGSIVVYGTASDANSTCGNGVIVSIKRGTQVLWQQTIDNGNTTGYTFNIPLNVATGEILSFVINNRDGDSNCDGTSFDPVIQYVAPATAKASSDYSSIQGAGGWYYLDGNGTQMTFDPADGQWHGSAPWSLLWGSAGHPGTTLDAVREWKAPVSGNVRITGTVSDGNSSCGNGVLVSIKKGTLLLWQQTIANGNTAGVAFDVTTAMAAGDALDFVINSRNDFGCDTTNFDPTVQYVPAW